MFSGCTLVSVDDKSRMAIPKKNRDDLSSEGGLVLTQHYSGHCLLLYPKPEWDRVIDGLRSKPQQHPVMQRVMRTMLAYAVECALDKTNRLLLPLEHRGVVGVGQSVMLVGQFNKFEIWDAKRWDDTQAQLKESYEDDAEAHQDFLSEFSI